MIVLPQPTQTVTRTLSLFYKTAVITLPVWGYVMKALLKHLSSSRPNLPSYPPAGCRASRLRRRVEALPGSPASRAPEKLDVAYF